MNFILLLITGLFGIFIHPTVLFGYKFPEMGYLAWFFLIPLFYSFIQNPTRLFLKSFLASCIFYTGCFYWLVNAMKNFGGLGLFEAIGVMLLVVLIQAAFWALGAWLAGVVTRRFNIPLFITLPVFLLSTDFIRTYVPVNGFPWGMAGYSQGIFLQFFEWVDVTGVYGLTLLIYLINGLLADIIFHIGEKKREGLLVRGLLIVSIVVISVFGSLARKAATFEDTAQIEGVRVGLVQGDIAQDLKWNLRVARENLEEHLRLSDMAAEEGAELAIWPETAYPFPVNLDTDTDFPYLFWKGRNVLKVPLYLGAVSTEGEGDSPVVRNSAFYLDTKAQIKSVYHKRHLVPFGEYIPLKEYLSFARRLTVAVGDFTPGRDPLLVDHGSLKLGTLICYEDIFPQSGRSLTQAGANVLVNLTNDAWYGNTSAPYQHLVFSQMRALENRRYLLRATNTGVTAIINSHGAVEEVLAPFAKGYLVKAVYPISHVTPYTLYGDWLPWLCVGLCLLSFLCLGLKFLSGKAYRSV